MNYDLVVMTYDRADAAEGAREAIKQMQREGRLTLADAAVLRSDASGKVDVDNELSRDVKIGAGIGALLGAIFTFFFPFWGLVLGAAGGALVGASLDRGVDQSFVEDVKASLKPNSSALFLVVAQGEVDALRAALEPYGGQVLQTTLDQGLADQLGDSDRA
ncbi:MAG TPA: DUF1269 domain-containing protein [Caldilineaceae bacterium]|nr:DUF1269 domain-containing protein [Caldilineaceae bacterium]